MFVKCEPDMFNPLGTKPFLVCFFFLFLHLGL